MASSLTDIDSISKACAYGDFEKLRGFVEADPECVSRPDESGYYPLQWAALNNRAQEASFLLAQHANVNAADHTGQTALHWGAVRGSLPVIEALLRAGADANARDNRGYTVAHVAAQYGQTAVLYHLALKWNVDIDVRDNDGRSPLHWASYKGFADTIRLLLVLDASYSVTDKEGCTPLHWAAIKGNAEACTVLLQGGATSVLNVRDVTGSTPAQLAVEKGHRYLGMHLAEQKQKQDGGGWFSKNSKLAWLTSTQLCPVIWLIIFGLVAVFCHKVLPPSPSPLLKWLGWSVVVSSSIGCFFLYKTTTSDPGIIPTGWEHMGSKARDKNNPRTQSPRDSGKLLGGGHHYPRGLDSPALWGGNWGQLCVSCRIVRPLRAKHCPITGRCVEVFDHYCPWVGNVVGKGNRHWFLVFLWLEMWALVVSASVGFVQLRSTLKQEHWNPSDMIWKAVFEILDVMVLISVSFLAFAQASQIFRNVTTNELANWHRYKYLQTPNGNFHNPFNQGCWRNVVTAFTPHKVPTAPTFLFGDGKSSCAEGCCDHSGMSRGGSDGCEGTVKQCCG